MLSSSYLIVDIGSLCTLVTFFIIFIIITFNSQTVLSSCCHNNASTPLLLNFRISFEIGSEWYEISLLNLHILDHYWGRTLTAKQIQFAALGRETERILLHDFKVSFLSVVRHCTGHLLIMESLSCLG